MLHEALQHRDVFPLKAHALGDLSDQRYAHDGVVARIALADVMQERSHQEQVGTLHLIHERRSFGGSFAKVAVYGEAVIHILLSQATAGLPFGQQL